MTSSDTAPNSGSALRVGVELELSFSDLLANGQGVGRFDGRVIFCFGPLPGERARVRVVEVKQRYAVAELVELLDRSNARAEPFCPVFGVCGGCQVQHLEYSAQLAWKRRVVGDALARIGGASGVEVRECVGMAHPREYRNKMALVVDHRRKPPAIGFYRQRSHDIVPIDRCPIVSPALNSQLEAIAAGRGSGAVGEMLADARHLVARSSRESETTLLTITTQRPSERARHAAPELLRELPALTGVSNSFDLASENAIVGRRRRVLAGEAEIEEALGGVRYRFSAGSFFQVNVEMVARIFEHLRPWLSGARKIVDLYCGVGTFALFFAKQGWSVYGIDESADAIAEARENARRNGLESRTRFDAGRVERLTGAPQVEKALREADVVFLDPPRKGCDEATLETVAQQRVPALWYLSCDPATLARDSKFLIAKGYRLGSVQPFDMFPQTGHVETLVTLEYSNLAIREH